MKPTRALTRNAALDADVRDLKQGFDAIEERARSELGMIERRNFLSDPPETASRREARTVEQVRYAGGLH